MRGLGSAIKFGLIGYRSPSEPWPDGETLVKDFTGTAVDHQQFTALLRDMQSKRPVLAAVAEAINGSWNEGATKLIVLIGDASAHEAPHPLAPSSYSAKGLRQLADEKGINIVAIYVKSSRRQAEWAIGMEQFKTLATNPGGTVAFVAVESTAKAIKQKVYEGTSLMVERVGELRKAADLARSAPRQPVPLMAVSWSISAPAPSRLATSPPGCPTATSATRTCARST